MANTNSTRLLRAISENFAAFSEAHRIRDEALRQRIHGLVAAEYQRRLRAKRSRLHNPAVDIAWCARATYNTLLLRLDW